MHADALIQAWTRLKGARPLPKWEPYLPMSQFKPFIRSAMVAVVDAHKLGAIEVNYVGTRLVLDLGADPSGAAPDAIFETLDIEGSTGAPSTSPQAACRAMVQSRRPARIEGTLRLSEGGARPFEGAAVPFEDGSDIVLFSVIDWVDEADMALEGQGDLFADAPARLRQAGSAAHADIDLATVPVAGTGD